MSASTFIIRFGIIVLIVFVIDFYVYKGIKTAISSFSSERVKQLVKIGYWTISVGFILLTLYAFTTLKPNENPRTGIFVLVMGSFVLLTVPKLIFGVILLFEDVFRVFRAISLYVGSWFSAQSVGAEEVSYWMNRRAFVSRIGLLIAAVPFVSILYGIIKGRYNYKVHKVEVAFDDLPEEFDGFTITQLSDVHAGSFDDMEAVRGGMELVKEQNSDMIVFTGDLVNNFSSEMEPYIQLFSELEAPFGKYSITGNHDYGDYVSWDSEEAKQANFEGLKQIHKKMGFNLLLNQNVSIGKGDSKFSLIGIENWGRGRFSKYGDLNKALEGVEKDSFKLLLSHDPSHWDDEVLGHDMHIHLSLAGHTHGMQFGIEIPGIKWSPVKYKYKNWAGLYGEKNKRLYVNRGFGFIGFPGRVGIWPEITQITLKRA